MCIISYPFLLNFCLLSRCSLDIFKKTKTNSKSCGIVCLNKMRVNTSISFECSRYTERKNFSLIRKIMSDVSSNIDVKNRPTNALHIYLSIYVLLLYIHIDANIALYKWERRSNNKIFYTQSTYNRSMKTIQYNNIHLLFSLAANSDFPSFHTYSQYATHIQRKYIQFILVMFMAFHEQQQPQHTLHNPNNFYVIAFYIWSVFEIHSKFSSSIDFQIYWI